MMLIYSCYQGIYLLADFKNVDINVNGMHFIRSMSRFAVLGEIFVSKMLTCYKVNKKLIGVLTKVYIPCSWSS